MSRSHKIGDASNDICGIPVLIPIPQKTGKKHKRTGMPQISFENQSL